MKLLDQVRQAARLRHLSPRTEKAYALWVRRFVVFHGTRHPRELGAAEIRAFRAHLAVERDEPWCRAGQRCPLLQAGNPLGESVLPLRM